MAGFLKFFLRNEQFVVERQQEVTFEPVDLVDRCEASHFSPPLVVVVEIFKVLCCNEKNYGDQSVHIELGHFNFHFDLKSS